MASNTDPRWSQAAPDSGGADRSPGGTPGGAAHQDPPDDRPAWLSGQGGTRILEGSTWQEPSASPSPPRPGTGWAERSSWQDRPPWEDRGTPWGDPAARPTTPLGARAPWDVQHGGAPQEPPPRPNRLRRGLAAALAAVVLIAAGYGASGLVEGGQTRQPTGAGVPPAQGGPGPVQGGGAEPVAAVAEALIPTVVRLQTDTGLGSGVIYDPEGYILTAAHVVADATTVEVRTADGNKLQGRVLGADAATDIGVVKVDGGNLPAATLATGVELKVGQMAVAIGSPFALQDTVTAGIISGLDRTLPLENGETRTVIQTDAPINQGNSGGPLADRQGRVIGINSAIRAGGIGGEGGNIGIGFAVPIDIAARVATAIVKGQPLETTYLGIRGGDSPVTAGALVDQVEAGSPAEAAGLKTGDLITGFDGEKIGGMSDLIAKTREAAAGEKVTLDVVRDGKSRKVEVTLGAKSP